MTKKNIILVTILFLSFFTGCGKSQEQREAEQAKLATEKAEQDKLVAEKAEQDKLAAEKAEQDKLATEKAEQDKLAAEKEKATRREAIFKERDRLCNLILKDAQEHTSFMEIDIAYNSVFEKHPEMLGMLKSDQEQMFVKHTKVFKDETKKVLGFSCGEDAICSPHMLQYDYIFDWFIKYYPYTHYYKSEPDKLDPCPGGFGTLMGVVFNAYYSAIQIYIKLHAEDYKLQYNINPESLRL